MPITFTDRFAALAPEAQALKAALEAPHREVTVSVPDPLDFVQGALDVCAAAARAPGANDSDLAPLAAVLEVASSVLHRVSANLTRESAQ